MAVKVLNADRSYQLAVTVLTYYKKSRNRPGVAQRFPGGLGSQVFITFGT